MKIIVYTKVRHDYYMHALRSYYDEYSQNAEVRFHRFSFF